MPLVLLGVIGCAERPKRSPLVNDTVYQNDRVGLRFLAPDGWALVSRPSLPSSPLPKPIILVGYHLSKGENHSELEVLAADLAEDEDLGRFLVEHRIGAAIWTLKPPAEPVSINGVDATRHTLTRQDKKGEMRPARQPHFGEAGGSITSSSPSRPTMPRHAMPRGRASRA